ncbi:MAG: TonB-dependent receptor domain-containing protein, partial [Candidatus Aminicenantales bacterium]
RFPSMKSLYSSHGGNPELRDERGTNYELGITYNKNFLVKGAVFYNRIKDLIQVIRLPEGFNSNMNIGQADIFGFELGLEKNTDWIKLAANYTFFKGENKEEKRSLDLLPQSQFNFTLETTLTHSLRLNLWGIVISNSEVNIYNKQVKIPGYFILNSILTKSLNNFNIFLKAENLFNKYYVTEPGYPMKARTITLGIKFLVE